MISAVLLLLLGFLLLIFGGNWFVDGAADIARKYRVPELLIGATIVSVGTTLPEVLVSTEAAAMGHGELAYGNAIGSIICNTAFISALSVTIKPTSFEKKSLLIPSLFFFAAAVFYAANSYIFGYFSRLSGIILLLIFAAYMFFNIKNAVNDSVAAKQEDSASGGEINVIKAIIMLAAGAAAIAFGSDLLVENGTIIAKRLGVPESVIGLTFIALGTSLPELVTAITSLIKGHSALSLGNIIGANFFNLVLVSGLSITVSPFEVPANKQIAGINSSLLIDIPLMFIVMLIITVPTMISGKTRRSQGIMLLLLYSAFCTLQFIL